MQVEKVKALMADARFRGQVKGVSVDDFIGICELALAAIHAQAHHQAPPPKMPASQDEADETDGLPPPPAKAKRK